MEQLRKNEMWTGDHKGIRFIVSHHGVSDYSPKGIWCFYVWFLEEQFPESFESFWLPPTPCDWGAKVRYDYSYSPLAALDWHCGITFYDKLGGMDGFPRSVKAGCDFNRLWDEESFHTLESVSRSARNCIDGILDTYRDEIKIRCPRNGKYYKREDGKENEHGVWFSHEGSLENKK